MIISNFQILYDNLTLYLDNYDFNDKLDELAKLFNLDKDEDFLLNELKINNTNNKDGNRYIYYFILGLLGKEGFKNKNLIKIQEYLKELLNIEINKKEPYFYSHILKSLYNLNNNDIGYFEGNYSNLKNNSKLHHDINSAFFEIFLDSKNNKFFLECFQQLIIDDITHYNFYSIKKGYSYLISLKNDDFVKYFTDLLLFFNNFENKSKLIKYHQYKTIFYIDRFSIKLDNENISNSNNEALKIYRELFLKIENINDDKLDEVLFNYLLSDLEFALDNFQSKITELDFINYLWDYFYKKDNDINLKILDYFESKETHLFGLEDVIIDHINKSNIEGLIKKLEKSKNNSNIIYFMYDILSYRKDKIDIFEIYKNIKGYKSKFKKRKTEIERNNSKLKKKKESDRCKKKDELLAQSKETGGYYEILFYEYYNFIERISNSNKSNYVFSEYFNKKELNIFNEGIKKQINSFLKNHFVEDYNIYTERVIYEKIDDTHYIPTVVANWMLWYVFEVGLYLKMDLGNNKKTFILYLPFAPLNGTLNKILNYYKNQIEKEDIDYVLKIYSIDKKYRIDNLRYYYPINIKYFYDINKDKFDERQIKKLSSIIKNILLNDIVENYSKVELFKTYKDICTRSELINLYKKNHFDFNYFERYKRRDEENLLDANKVFLDINLNKILIQKFNYKKAILWRFKKLKEGIISIKNPHEHKYGESGTKTFFVTPEYEEFFSRFDDNEENFIGELKNIGIAYKNNFIELFEMHFQILLKIDSGEYDNDYKNYANYLLSGFLKYLENLDIEYTIKNDLLFEEINKIILKYNNIYFNSSELFKIFGKDSMDKRVENILNSKNPRQELKNILKELNESKNYSLELNQKIETYDKENLEFLINKKVILFVEGTSDKIIIDNAWEKLYPNEDKFFIVESCFGARNLTKIFTENSKILNYQNKICIGLMDFDYEGYNQIEQVEQIDKKNNLKLERDVKIPILDYFTNNISNLDELITTEDNSITKSNKIKEPFLKFKDSKNYLTLLPIPNFRNDYASLIIGNRSLLTIELMFRDELIGDENLKKIVFPGNKELNIFNGDKIIFANKTGSFSANDFETFKPIFDLIRNISNK